MLTQAEAQRALRKKNTALNIIQPETIERLLAPTRGVTFANVIYVTQVKTAAANKDKLVQKVTQASVQLFNNLTDASNAYAAAVKRSAEKLGATPEEAQGFQVQDNYFEHTDTFSLVRHKTQDKFYLYCLYNKGATSTLYIDGDEATKEDVAALLTPSAAAMLLAPSTVVHNVSNDMDHNVTVRTIALSSIVQITANGETVLIN